MATPVLRRTRIVCISDTHNCTVNLPKGDVLIHAGDLTNQGSFSELSRAVRWLEAADFEAKIVVAGNHDITLDSDFYTEHGLHFHNQSPQSAEECLALFTSSPSITYLYHDSATIRLRSPSGPHTELTVFGSPYSPRNGLWAFYYDVPLNFAHGSELTSLWELIPLNTDIVVTHTPPRTHCDGLRNAGCEALRRGLWRVRPKLAVCGHVHEGRGAERVTWDLTRQDLAYAEKQVLRWDDSGARNNKMSLVDLTGKHSMTALANDGSDPSRPHLSLATFLPQPAASLSSAQVQRETFFASSRYSFDPSVMAALPHRTADGSVGLGGDLSSPHCDREALAGRTGRAETCVVNAAIMKSAYPHIGGKKFHKPIVVDVELPVWREEY